MLAASDDFPRIHVPLEAIGDAVPRLVDFEVMRPPNRDIALLRFIAGTAGETDIQHVAILDLSQNAVLGTVPDRIGQREAKWSWEDNRLVIAAVDGLTDEFQLRGGRGPLAVAAAPSQRRQDGPRTYAPPNWLPWEAQGPQPQRRGQRQQRPKTLFDMIFGN